MKDEQGLSAFQRYPVLAGKIKRIIDLTKIDMIKRKLRKGDTVPAKDILNTVGMKITKKNIQLCVDITYINGPFFSELNSFVGTALKNMSKTERAKVK